MNPTSLSEWSAFIAAIVANPDDDTCRLVAADFLEENGDPDRAAFIRIQIAIARLEADGQGKSAEADRLRAKEREFIGPLSMYRTFWAAEACPELVRIASRVDGRDSLEGMTVAGADRLTWQRGFVEAVTCPVEEWLRHGAAVRQRQPIQHLALLGADETTREQWYELIPLLKGLRLVALVRAEEETVRWLQGWLPGVHVALSW